MEISQEGVTLIKHYEGCPKDTDGNAVSYRCPANKLTIGYGSLKLIDGSPVKDDMSITMQEAEDLLTHELKQYQESFKTKVSWVRDDDKVHSIRDVQGGQDLGWAAGPTAIWLAIKNEQPQQVYLLGHDLNSKTNNINNLYKGTPNYNPINHKPTPSVNWFIQLQALMNENPDIAFYKVNDEPIDNNSKVNRRHPQFNEFKNLEYITYKELQMRVDNKW